MRWTALALLALALALTGCETSAEKSAKLEREAKRHLAQNVHTGLTITRASTKVKVLGTTLVSGSEGTAAVVTLRNTSARALHDVPLAITVRDAHGATVYSNSAPGLARTLTSAPLLAAHGTLLWVDDQVQAAGGTAASVSARVGEAPVAAGSLPRISVQGVKLFEDQVNGIGAEGNVVNASHVNQQALVVYAVARRGGRIVAAGRSILPLLQAGSSTRFQVFFVGDPAAAKLLVSAPPTTLR